jgi:hypothetical protein
LVSLPARGAGFDQLQRGNAVDDDEVAARRLARAAHDLGGEAHAVPERPAPGVAAPVGARRKELRDEIALGSHHLDAVVARLAGERGGAGEVGDRLLDLLRRHFARDMRVDRRLERRRRDDALVKAVAPRMQKLQHDAAAGVVHCFWNNAVALSILACREFGAMLTQIAGAVGREAAGGDERGAAFRSLGIERGEAFHAIGPRLEPGMHRAHHDAVGQRGEAQIERLK